MSFLMRNKSFNAKKNANLDMLAISVSSAGCSGKFVLFHFPLQPIPHHNIAAREFQSSQPIASVQ